MNYRLSGTEELIEATLERIAKRRQMWLEGKARKATAEEIERERERVEAAEAAARAEDERRAADRAHRGAVNSRIKSELIALGLSDEQAIAVIKAMARGEISNVKITY